MWLMETKFRKLHCQKQNNAFWRFVVLTSLFNLAYYVRFRNICSKITAYLRHNRLLHRLTIFNVRSLSNLTFANLCSRNVRYAHTAAAYSTSRESMLYTLPHRSSTRWSVDHLLFRVANVMRPWRQEHQASNVTEYYRPTNNPLQRAYLVF